MTGDSMSTPIDALEPAEGDALILVDVQNDFVPPAGALAVDGGREVIAPLNRMIEIFRARGLPIVATRDWHPPNHISFREQGGPWPPHCVQNSEGAQFVEGLALPPEATIISSATTPEKEAYSGFDHTDLDARLRSAQVSRVYVGGIATDYCVRETVMDALKLGYEVVLLQDAIRAVNVNPDDGDRAEREMREQGAVEITTDSVL